MSRHPRTRRLIATFVTFVLAVSGLLIVSAGPASAANTRAFTPVFTANTTGDVIIRGNSLETCLAGSTQAQGTITCASAQGGASQQNNNYFMDYIDADGTTGNSTFDSSSATVTVPTGATVLYAGLSWGAVTSAGALTNYPALTGVAAPNAALRTNALFQAPGASSYSTVTSSTTDNNGTNYQAYADVTDTVKAAGSGTYTVANVQAGTGGGNYAGWSLAVAFSDPTMPTRNLVVFTGYNQVSGTTPSVDIPVTGFQTPATGAVTTKIGVVAYEGDKGSTGDGMSVGGTSLYNALNPINDVFNSSLTDMNVAVTDRTPNYPNMLGFDIDRLDATGVLPNGSTSTTVHLTTANPGGETYYPGMLTFATNLYASGLTATKTVTDLNGGNVARNDQLRYSVTVTNGGGDGAATTVLTDAAPANTVYLPGSLTINGAAMSDATGDDVGDVSSGGNVTARLGTGATSSAGGLLGPNGTATVTFVVTVNVGNADGAAVVNTALFTNQDQTTGTGYSGGSNTVTSIVVVPPTLSGTLAGGEVTAPYSSGFTVSGGTGPYVWTVSSGPLPAGLSINSSTGLITGTPTASGSFPITVQVTDANNRTATRTQPIAVVAGPTVAFTAANGEVGVAYTAQPTASGGTSPYTWAVSTGTLPDGLSINTSTGAITGNPTTAAATTITVQATDAKGGTASQARTITIVPAPTLTGTLAGGELTAPYSSGYPLSDGVGPFTWTITSGTLPAGLAINASTGLITGTPTATGNSTITVQVTDTNGRTATRSGTITVTDGPAVAFTPPNGEVGVAYTAQPTASGGTSPYTWAVIAGTLPAGLSINPSTGAITGTPTAAITRGVTVQATDSVGGTAALGGLIVIVAAPSVTSAAPVSGKVGTPYTTTFAASGGLGTYTWSVSAGTLPLGLTLNSSTGVLSGTPSAAGTTTFTIKVTDPNAQFGTQTVNLLVKRSAETVSLAASTGSVRFGTAITLTATLAPLDATGAVTFTVVPTTGPQAGSTVTLGTAPVISGVATLTIALPAFGANPVTADYDGDDNHIAATSAPVSVEAVAYAGELIVTEFRTSGPGGANDSYVELLNTGPPVPMAGIKISADSGAVSTLPANAGLLGTGRSYLLTGAGFTLAAIATSDYSVATVGTGGMQVTAPDTANTQTDAVGPATGFHIGTGLPAITGNPDSQWAWVRSELAGAAVNTNNNSADFQLVSTTLALVGGAQPTLGSASPTGTADPYQHNATLQSTLLDTGMGVAVAPNRVVVAGTPRHLVIRRTITNTTGQTITAAKVRISALSEQFGALQPGVGSQPASKVWLRAIAPGATTEQVTVGVTSVTVQNLSVDAPNSGGLGGGLNSTFTVPLPGGGLAPGAKINVAFTFAVDTGGTFWFGYDVDAN